MTKSKINFIIDALMMLCIAAMAGIGFLLEWVLLTGREARVVYGAQVELELAGMSRHEWGDIHLYIAYALIALLVLHIVLHWGMIVGIYQKLIGNRAARWVVGVVFVVATALLTAFPALVTNAVVVAEKGPGHGDGLGRGGGRALAPGDERGGGGGGFRAGRGGSGERGPAVEGEARGPGAGEVSSEEGERIYSIRGNMTIGEVSREYGVPIEYLAERLGIKEKVSPGDRLGWLRRDYDFTMSDVDKAIQEYKKSQSP